MTHCGKINHVQLTQDQIAQFENDGFLIVKEKMLDEFAISKLREQFIPLFSGNFETGVQPDEWHPRICTLSMFTYPNNFANFRPNYISKNNQHLV